MSADPSSVRGAVAAAVAFLLLAACGSVGGEPPASESLQGVATTPAVRVVEEPLATHDLQTLGLAGDVSHAFRYRDAHGDYAAVFARTVTHEEDPEDGVVTDRIVLSAVLDRLPGSQVGEARRWQHSGEIECDGVDIEADFFPAAFSVTDLDGDGTAEVTFAYHRFCGGGIDPRDVTVVLQEGGSSYVLEGQTLVQVGDDPAFGGEFEMDAALAAAPAWLREKVLATWDKVRNGPGRLRAD